MGLIALGINHKSANVALRERVAFAPEQMSEALQDALRDAHLAEAVILSTCNRTELFVIEQPHDGDALVDPGVGEHRLLEWLGAYHHIPLADLQHCYYAYRDEQALRHMIQVASGLDSMVMGEPQIFGQIKSAFAVAQEAQTVGAELSRMLSLIHISEPTRPY